MFYLAQGVIELSEVREIVAAKINGSRITNNMKDIIDAAKTGRVNEIFCRKQMKFMSGCDLGVNWDKLAKGETLFYLVDGKPTFEKPECLK